MQKWKKIVLGSIFSLSVLTVGGLSLFGFGANEACAQGSCPVNHVWCCKKQSNGNTSCSCVMAGWC